MAVFNFSVSGTVPSKSPGVGGDLHISPSFSWFSPNPPLCTAWYLFIRLSLPLLHALTHVAPTPLPLPLIPHFPGCYPGCVTGPLYAPHSAISVCSPTLRQLFIDDLGGVGWVGGWGCEGLGLLVRWMDGWQGTWKRGETWRMSRVCVCYMMPSLPSSVFTFLCLFFPLPLHPAPPHTYISTHPPAVHHSLLPLPTLTPLSFFSPLPPASLLVSPVCQRQSIVPRPS